MGLNNLFKLANLTYGQNAQQSEGNLQKSISNMQALQSKTIFNEANIVSKIESNLATLKSYIDQFLNTKNQSLVPQIVQQQNATVSSILLLSPEGIKPNPELYAKYSLVLQNFLSLVK